MFSYDSMIKQEYPMSSQYHLPTPDRDLFQHCLTTFYDHDSSDDIIQANCSVQQVLCYLQHTIDICDTPLADIMQTVATNPAFKGVDHDLLRRKLIKQKNLLKRTRAKTRKTVLREHRAPAAVLPVEDEEEQFKKQRNRISAQVSRDKKKEKMKALQELNRQLQEECKQQREQNERLRREANKQGQNNDEPLKHRFTKMLIFLGIIFLFGLVRDIFQGNQSTKTIAKIQQTTHAILSSKDYHPYYHQEHSTMALQEIEQALTETFQDKGIATRIKDKIGQSIGWWKEGGPILEESGTVSKRDSVSWNLKFD